MLPKYDEKLPKLLGTTLEQLVCDHKLLKWNLQAHDNIVYVNLCFVPPEMDTMSTPLPGYRKKSPSQAVRDYERHKQWKSKHNTSQDYSEKQCNDGFYTQKDDKDLPFISSDRSCLTGGRSVPDIEPGQHDMCDPDIDVSNEDSLRQDHQNSSTCSGDVTPPDHTHINPRLHIEKVVYDDSKNCLIAKTTDGQCRTYKYHDDTKDSQAEYLYQSLHEVCALTINHTQMNELLETSHDVMDDPKYQTGIEYLTHVIKYNIT